MKNASDILFTKHYTQLDKTKFKDPGSMSRIFFVGFFLVAQKCFLGILNCFQGIERGCQQGMVNHPFD